MADIFGKADPNAREVLPESEVPEEMAPQRPRPSNIMDILAKMGGKNQASGELVGDENPNGGWSYTDYHGMNENYIPLDKTYKKMEFEPTKWESHEYEPMEYESHAGGLFGHDDVDHLGQSHSMKPTGVGERLFNSEESELFKPSKENDKLFSNEGQEPNPWLENTKVPAIVQSEPMMPQPGNEYNPVPQNVVPSAAEILATIERRRLAGIPPSYSMPTPTMPNQVQPSGQPKIKRKPGRPRKYPLKQQGNTGISIPQGE